MVSVTLLLWRGVSLMCTLPLPCESCHILFSLPFLLSLFLILTYTFSQLFRVTAMKFGGTLLVCVVVTLGILLRHFGNITLAGVKYLSEFIFSKYAINPLRTKRPKTGLYRFWACSYDFNNFFLFWGFLVKVDICKTFQTKLFSSNSDEY